MTENNRILTARSTLVASGVGLGLFCLCLRYRKNIFMALRNAFNFNNPLRHKHIEIIETTDECKRVVEILKRHCHDYKVLGFDCEWLTVNGVKRPTALLQLASHNGLCALFRLCCLHHVPKSLRELLEDDDILKVGVGPFDDAKFLMQDYGVIVNSTLDLRFFAQLTGHKAEGLGKLAKSVLNVEMDKDWRISCSNWENPGLSYRQRNYAANDALVAVRIFEKFAVAMQPCRHFWQFSKLEKNTLHQRLSPYKNMRFKNNMNVQPWTFNTNLDRALNDAQNNCQPQTKQMQQKRGMSTRTRNLYDNCVLEAPDGELLCTIDRRKAQWYLDQNLAVEVKAEPLTVRLNFEPAGRAVGEVGRYYQTARQNQCVVCGFRERFLRKNVVPHEYRKHFPEVMKSHSSHDVLLLCPDCHQHSNISDQLIRTRLANICDAPCAQDLASRKYIEDKDLKALKSAARALLLHAEKIGEVRLEQLKQIVLQHYPNEQQLTPQLLEEAANVDVAHLNDDYYEHGLKVVEKYQNELGGLAELERIWRQHFLDAMKPKFMPKLWDVNHNAKRLQIRAQEGRVEPHDLISAGVNIAN